MGFQELNTAYDADQLRSFTNSLLNDVRALELMLERGMLEAGAPRIGAEQELFIIDRAGRPARKAMEILDRLADPHFTTELATYNLEFNLDPLELNGACLRELEMQLQARLKKVKAVARKSNADVLMIGILPTLRRSDVGLDSMSPKPRYFAINDALARLRGSKEYEVFVHGTDELYIRPDSMMLEAANTSFQVHLQVDPHRFAQFYNIAQAVAGPVLAVAANSPILFGKRLWHETRIAIFQQATDTRQPNPHTRESLSRVHFGNGWVRNSALEIFHEDIARFRVLLGVEINENPFEVLEKGSTPILRALQLHNGTVYRWNRPCYGITNGKPHLRIENRILPSGPTVIDEIANAAFWLGVVHGLASVVPDIATRMDFDDARTNFLTAARRGIESHFIWFDTPSVSAQTLVLEELLPLARKGLKLCNIDAADIHRYLSIIENRVATKQTGAMWQLNSCASMKNKVVPSDCQSSIALTAARHQDVGTPVHEWSLAAEIKTDEMRCNHRYVEDFMSTDVFSVNPDDPVDLVLSVMQWRRIRHLPVEDSTRSLKGVVDYRSIIKLFNNGYHKNGTPVPVADIMQTDVPTVSPTTPTLAAISLMCQKGVTCLPVVTEGKLVGIVTQNDFMRIAAQYLEQGLGSDASNQTSQLMTYSAA